jgi:hypothetical protein
MRDKRTSDTNKINLQSTLRCAKSTSRRCGIFAAAAEACPFAESMT